MDFKRHSHVLYYENQGKVEDINVTWTDSPENWSDPNNSETCIKIELKTVEGTLIYNVTVFISTGTIRVQGIQYKLFIDYHFNILTEILSLLSDHQRDDQRNQQAEPLLDETTCKQIVQDQPTSSYERLEKAIAEGFRKERNVSSNKPCN
jgi:hypothetical protein